MEVDWDLQAVVRGCTGASSSSSATTSTSSSFVAFPTVHGGNSVKSEPAGPHKYLSFGSESQAGGHLFSLPVPDPFEARQSGNLGDLHELFRPFLFPQSHQPPQVAPRPVVSSLSSLCFSKEQTQLRVLKQQQHQPAKMLPSLGGSVAPTTSSQGPRSKRRKNQLKKVCHVPAEALSSDVWAWRKYGQKPIKGSPYPRGYYRCSSSKGCLARKQVERNRSDPRMFIVTYTAEHNHPAPTHRNSLAGSTRQKALTSATSAGGGEDADKATKPACSSSPATSLEDELPPMSANTESREEEKDLMEDEEVEQEEDFGGFPDTEVNDDFFAGLEEFAAGSPGSDAASGDRFPDHFAGSFGVPWFPSSAATTAGGV